MRTQGFTEHRLAIAATPLLHVQESETANTYFHTGGLIIDHKVPGVPGLAEDYPDIAAVVETTDDAVDYMLTRPEAILLLCGGHRPYWLIETIAKRVRRKVITVGTSHIVFLRRNA